MPLSTYVTKFKVSIQKWEKKTTTSKEKGLSRGASGPRKRNYDVKIGVTDMYISGLVSALAKAPRPKK